MGDRLNPGLPPGATVGRPPAADFPDVVEGWKGRSRVTYVQVAIGQPLVATVCRPPAADFPDVVESWNGLWWDCRVQRLRIRMLQGIGMVLSSACGGLSLCC